jgi:uncharacterized protein YecT (DUF1311 family)
MKKLVFAILTGVMLFGLDCNNAQNTIELNKCAQMRFDDADIELNVVYKKLKRYLNKNEMAKLRDAQRAWIKYRDKSAEFAASMYEGGTFASVAYMNEKARITEQRVKELKALLRELESM